MTKSLIDDSFEHHAWATLQMIDACAALAPEQLDTIVPGTYGSILDTIRHVVGGDSFYLANFGEETPAIDEDGMDLADLRTNAERFGSAWLRFLARDLNPDENVHEVDDYGYQRDASIGLRLAQALMHGAEHRSQICTAITSLGIEPPPIDAWDFGEQTGRVVDIPPPS